MCFLPFLNFIEFVLVLPAPPAGTFIFCAGVWGKSFFTNDCHSVRQLAGAARPRTPRFRSCGGCPPPRPGEGEFRPPRGEGRIGGYAPPNPAVHFWTPKSEPKNRQNQGFGFLFLSVSIRFGTSLRRIRFLSANLRSGAQRDSACRPVKGGHISWDTYRNMVLVTQSREYS